MKRQTDITNESYLQTVWRRFKHHHLGVASLILLSVICLAAVLAPIIAPHDPDAIVGPFSEAPSLRFWLGTDQIGRDMLSRLLYATRISLLVGLLATAISTAVGVVLGLLAGYFGGWLDMLIMRFLDIFHSIPQVLLAVIVSTVLGPGLFQTVFAVGIGGIPNFARTIRAQILSVRGLEYVEAAESINCSKARIIFRHVIPNSITPFIVHCSLAMANGLIVASTLSYIGLGVQPPTPEWGAMLSDARLVVRQYPTQMLFPGIFIMGTVMSFNLLGDALRDTLDPKLNK